MKEKMESLGFKDVGGYFIPANASEGHVGYMRAHAADLARAPFICHLNIPPFIPPFGCLNLNINYIKFCLMFKFIFKF
jgi:hypothetical protein